MASVVDGGGPVEDGADDAQKKRIYSVSDTYQMIS